MLYNKIILPVILSVTIGTIMYHYESLFEDGYPIYLKITDQRIVSVPDQNYISSIFSIHNESDDKIDNVTILGSVTSSDFSVFRRIKSQFAVSAGEKFEKNGSKFKVIVPELKSGDVLNYELVISSEESIGVRYNYFHDLSVIPNGSSFIFSYSVDKYLYFLAFAIIALSYILILLSFYIKWTHSIFPGFFKSRSEAGFALLYSGEFEGAKKYIKEISNTGHGLSIFDLSNLAACHALLGDIESGRRYIDAAKINSFSKKLTILQLSDFVVKFCAGEIENGGDIKNIKSLPVRYLDESPVLKKICNNEWPRQSLTEA